MPPPLQGQLVPNNRGPLDPECGVRVLSQLHLKTPPPSPSKATNWIGTTREGTGDQGNPYSTRERSNTACQTRRSRLLQQPLHCAEEGWWVSSSDKSQSSELSPQHPTFQDGGDSEFEGHPDKSRLHGQTGPTGCVPECSHAQEHVQISEVLLGGGRLRVFVPPIRSRPGTHGFYKAFETSSVLSQTTGNTDLGVFGRYTLNGTISERSRDPRPDDNSVAWLPGVCPEHEEMPDHSQSNDGVPGFSSRLTEHDSISPRNQSVEDQERMQAHEKPVSRDREAVSSLNRSPDVLLASNLSGTPTLPGTTASQEPGLGSGGYIIRQEDSYVKGCTAGSSLVDSTAVFTNGQTDSQSTTRHGPRNRCVNERMGSEPPQGRNFDRGLLVSKGSYPSHQLARTERGISSSTVLRKQPQQHSHPTEDGQPGGSYICEQEGGNKVEGPLRLSTEAMGLVHQTFDHSGSTSLARTSEHNCRLREPPPDRLKRLESGSSSVQSDHQAAGEVQYRFVHQLPEHQTGPILQLETRPQIPGSGCSGPAMGGSQPIPVSSFLSDRSLFTKVEARRCSSCPPGGTSMATTGMVPCSPGDVNGCSKDTSPRPVTGDRPRGKSTPPTGAREAKAGGLAYIRQSLEKQGISEQGAELYCASWRLSTTRAYTSCWQRWIDWCGTRSTDPSKAPVGQIVAFLTDLFKEGKEHSTINSYRSAISAMHSAQIGLDPTLNRFMQGLFNSRPSKPKYTCIWDVDTVLGFMKTMPPLQELSLTKLSWKLVTLLALSNADRASDLQLLDINYLHIFGKRC